MHPPFQLIPFVQYAKIHTLMGTGQKNFAQERAFIVIIISNPSFYVRKYLCTYKLFQSKISLRTFVCFANNSSKRISIYVRISTNFSQYCK